jgi:hypothetical protein
MVHAQQLGAGGGGGGPGAALPLGAGGPRRESIDADAIIESAALEAVAAAATAGQLASAARAIAAGGGGGGSGNARRGGGCVAGGGGGDLADDRAAFSIDDLRDLKGHLLAEATLGSPLGSLPPGAVERSFDSLSLPSIHDQGGGQRLRGGRRPHGGMRSPATPVQVPAAPSRQPRQLPLPPPRVRLNSCRRRRPRLHPAPFRAHRRRLGGPAAGSAARQQHQPQQPLVQRNRLDSRQHRQVRSLGWRPWDGPQIARAAAPWRTLLPTETLPRGAATSPSPAPARPRPAPPPPEPTRPTRRLVQAATSHLRGSAQSASDRQPSACAPTSRRCSRWAAFDAHASSFVTKGLGGKSSRAGASGLSERSPPQSLPPPAARRPPPAAHRPPPAAHRPPPAARRPPPTAHRPPALQAAANNDSFSTDTLRAMLDKGDHTTSFGERAGPW